MIQLEFPFSIQVLSPAETINIHHNHEAGAPYQHAVHSRESRGNHDAPYLQFPAADNIFYLAGHFRPQGFLLHSPKRLASQRVGILADELGHRALVADVLWPAYFASADVLKIRQAGLVEEEAVATRGKEAS